MDNQTLIIIISIVILVTTSNLILWFFLHSKGRKAPMGIVNDGVRMFYLTFLKRNKRYFLLSNVEGRDIWYDDWDRGLGHGYMEDPLRMGDVLLANSNRPDRYHLLMVYRLRQPDETNAKFFIFRTFYLGTKTVEKVKRRAETDKELGGFQTYV